MGVCLVNGSEFIRLIIVCFCCVSVWIRWLRLYFRSGFFFGEKNGIIWRLLVGLVVVRLK